MTAALVLTAFALIVVAFAVGTMIEARMAARQWRDVAFEALRVAEL